MYFKTKYLRNKFVIAFVLFLIWIVFIDQNSFRYLHKLDKKVTELKTKKSYYQAQIKQEKQDLKDLSNDKKLQKYAREKLLMKKEGEDIYIIEKQK